MGHWYVINGYSLTINNARQMAVPATNNVTGQAGVILLTPVGATPGDMDCDGDVDFDDIDPFVQALESQAGYEAAYPNCCYLNADTDGDGDVDFNDIDAFVNLLGG